MGKLTVKKQGPIGRGADIVMTPLMYLLQGTLRESPQRTHRWNNTKLHVSEIKDFDDELMVSAAGDIDAAKRWLGPVPLFHMPLIGGWDEFVVVAPKKSFDTWYVGWIPSDLIGISNIALTTPVRLLIGPRPVHFFGVNENGEQIPVEIVGRGMVGNAAEFSQLPLL